VSRIKIDRSFVAKITDNAQDAAIVRSLIAMAHNLGLGIIAEGVETVEQARFLMKEHCEEAQGFLYAKPLAAADFEAYLASHLLAREGSGAVDNAFYRAGSAGRGSVRPSNRRRPRA
jgi:EAL domain-containing protein (putative c-di-GMP-specific phosphodiesterase class I)